MSILGARKLRLKRRRKVQEKTNNEK